MLILAPGSGRAPGGKAAGANNEEKYGEEQCPQAPHQPRLSGRDWKSGARIVHACYDAVGYRKRQQAPARPEVARFWQSQVSDFESGDSVMTKQDGVHEGYLGGQLLAAMPTIGDPRFERTLIYICAHNEEGAMGLVLNRLVESLDFPDLLTQLGIDPGDYGEEIRIHFGGPVETGRGFVLHSAEYLQEATLQVDERLALTATVDILRDMAEGKGPRRSLLALGYAGWGAGQLDQEIQQNGWLTLEPDESLLFGARSEEKWDRAMAKLGLDVGKLSSLSGHA